MHGDVMRTAASSARRLFTEFIDGILVLVGFGGAIIAFLGFLYPVLLIQRFDDIMVEVGRDVVLLLVAVGVSVSVGLSGLCLVLLVVVARFVRRLRFVLEEISRSQN